MKDIASNLPGLDELLRLVRAQRNGNSSADMLPSLALFGAGILLGAGLALLLAPSSGAELRETLSEQFAEAAQKMRGGTDAETPPV